MIFLKRWVLCSMVCLFILAGIAACDAPGEGKKAEQGYALCRPVIDALDDYYRDHQAYPEHLNALVPGYIDQVPDTFDSFPIEYEAVNGSYNLTFCYQRPGMNRCTYTPETQWDSEGYF
jgi:hypothetical protein